MDEKPAELRQVMHPVDDVAAALEFYRSVFGFQEKFSDGDRYAALYAGGPTLALVSQEEDITDGRAAAAVKVADVETAVQAVIEAGGSVVRSAAEGPHEVRAVVADPWGNALVVYAPL
jgi:predicted enzyme related to lactoylglutathione lyase